MYKKCCSTLAILTQCYQMPRHLKCHLLFITGSHINKPHKCLKEELIYSAKCHHFRLLTKLQLEMQELQSSADKLPVLASHDPWSIMWVSDNSSRQVFVLPCETTLQPQCFFPLPNVEGSTKLKQKLKPVLC